MDTVLNWLWQGGVVGLAAAGLLRVIPGSHTLARYFVVWTACIMVLALPAVSFLLAAASPIPAATDYQMPLAVLGPVVSIPSAWWTSTSLAIALWLLWAGVQAGWVAAAGLSLRRTRRQCREFPQSVATGLYHWSRVKTAGRRTRLVLTNRVHSAAVLGCGSPIIGVAPALLEHLDVEDLDRIVIHEWAHVQRRDDIAQYLQLMVRIVAGWHPAVWWLERQLELEREVACDETAVAVTGSAKRYAACLTMLAGLSRAVRPLPVLGAVSSSGLCWRITRILAVRHGRSARPWRVIGLAAGAALVALALTVANVHVVELAVPAVSLRAVAPLMTETTITKGGTTISGSKPQPVSSSTSVPARRSPLSREISTAAKRLNSPSPVPVVEIQATPEVPAVVMTVMPSQSLEWPFGNPVSPSVETSRPLDPPVTAVVEPVAQAASGNNGKSAEATARAPWAAAADAGVSLGRSSQNAGVATASFFNRVGKKIAGSF